MEGQRHGRFFAQELPLEPGANQREQIQDALDAGERQEWDLLGVSDAPAGAGVILQNPKPEPSLAKVEANRRLEACVSVADLPLPPQPGLGARS